MEVIKTSNSQSITSSFTYLLKIVAWNQNHNLFLKYVLEDIWFKSQFEKNILIKILNNFQLIGVAGPRTSRTSSSWFVTSNRPSTNATYSWPPPSEPRSRSWTPRTTFLPCTTSSTSSTSCATTITEPGSWRLVTMPRCMRGLFDL